MKIKTRICFYWDWQKPLFGAFHIPGWIDFYTVYTPVFAITVGILRGG